MACLAIKTGFQGSLGAVIHPRRRVDAALAFRAGHATASKIMKDISYIAAFPKSGITYLNFMLFHILFDRPQDVRLIDSNYIFDVHESLARVPPPGDTPRYVKIHFSYGPRIPLRERAGRAVYLLRNGMVCNRDLCSEVCSATLVLRACR